MRTPSLAAPVAPLRAAAPAPPTTWSFWAGFWITMRPYLAFVSGSAALVGMAFADRPSPARLACAVPALFLSYGLGQALTDCFQTDTDALSAPYRPLVRGAIARRHVLGVAAAGLTACAGILVALDRRTALPAALAVAGLVAYTPMKRRWWAGPPWNAAIVASLPLLGWYAAGGAPGAAPRGFGTATAAVSLAYADFVLTGYFKDIAADRAAGYRTLPVVARWRTAAWAAHGVAAAALVAAAGAVATSPSVVAWLVLGAGALVSARAHAELHRIRQEHLAHRPISGVVRAFILYAGAIAVGRKPEWLLPLAALPLAFELALRARPERTQV